MLKYVILLIVSLCSINLVAQQWRTEPISPLDQQYIAKQLDSIDSLARRHLGRQLNGTKDNDLKVVQQLLDKGLVRNDQVTQLQAMGIVLGHVLKEQKGLNWVIYVDKLGRSRALQSVGIKEFIFPTTQISRRAEVGIKVNVAKVYAELEQAVADIRSKPETFD